MSRGNAKPQTRTVNFKTLVLATSGNEQKYPVYQFSKGKRRFEKPSHNPFD